MLTAIALVAIAAGMIFCASTLVSLWIAARKLDNKGEGPTRVE
jgi:hypothetical protein